MEDILALYIVNNNNNMRFWDFG